MLTVVAGSGDDDGSVDGVGVHAALVVVVHADESPVGDHTGDVQLTSAVLAGDEVLDSSSVEELDVRELQDLGEHGAGEESGVLDDDEVGVWAIVLVRDTDLTQEGIGGLPHDHGAEELTSEPSASTWSDTSLDNGDLEVWTGLGEAVGGRETAATSSDDNDVTLGVLVQVGEVPPGHSPRDLRLSDVGKLEVAPLAGHLLNGLLLGVSTDWDGGGVRHRRQLGCCYWNSVAIGGGWLLEVHGRWRHVDDWFTTFVSIIPIAVDEGDESMILSLVLSR